MYLQVVAFQIYKTNWIRSGVCVFIVLISPQTSSKYTYSIHTPTPDNLHWLHVHVRLDVWTNESNRTKPNMNERFMIFNLYLNHWSMIVRVHVLYKIWKFQTFYKFLRVCLHFNLVNIMAEMITGSWSLLNFLKCFCWKLLQSKYWFEFIKISWYNANLKKKRFYYPDNFISY